MFRSRPNHSAKRGLDFSWCQTNPFNVTVPLFETIPSAATEFRGFLTAGSNREVKVSEAALSSARARLTAADEGVSEEDEVPR